MRRRRTNEIKMKEETRNTSLYALRTWAKAKKRVLRQASHNRKFYLLAIIYGCGTRASEDGNDPRDTSVVVADMFRKK